MLNISILFKEYVEGKIKVEEFEQTIYKNVVQIENELTVANEFKLYQSLIETDYSNYGEQLNICGYLQEFLSKNGIAFAATNKYNENFDLILDAFPKWIDSCCESEKYIREQLLSQIDPNLSKQKMKSWLKEKIKKWYPHMKIPKWIQSPNWPFSNGKPMMFMGQVNLDNSTCFHDTTSLYVFFCIDTGEYKVIKQSY